MIIRNRFSVSNIRCEIKLVLNKIYSNLFNLPLMWHIFAGKSIFVMRKYIKVNLFPKLLNLDFVNVIAHSSHVVTNKETL